MPTGISGIGVEGDVVEVKRGLFRNHLQPGGLAVYASPQDLKEKAKVFVCLQVNGACLSVTKIESNSLWYVQEVPIIFHYLMWCSKIQIVMPVGAIASGLDTCTGLKVGMC